MKNVRYPARVTHHGDDPACPDYHPGAPAMIQCAGHTVDLDIDDLERNHPETFARWVSLECTGTDEQISRVALAQAYHAQDAGLELAAADLRALTFPSTITTRMVADVEDGHEETIRDALYHVSRAMVDAPRFCGIGHTIARARLLAVCEANGIDTEGNEDPAKLRGESRR